MKLALNALQTDTASVTLTKAVVRASGILQVKQSALARILGLSPSTVSRMVAGTYQLSAERSKEWELALLFVRMFRSIDAIFGHSESALKWLSGNNLALHGAPIALIESTEGLVRVIHYLDAHRGRI